MGVSRQYGWVLWVEYQAACELSAIWKVVYRRAYTLYSRTPHLHYVATAVVLRLTQDAESVTVPMSYIYFSLMRFDGIKCGVRHYLSIPTVGNLAIVE